MTQWLPPPERPKKNRPSSGGGSDSPWGVPDAAKDQADAVNKAVPPVSSPPPTAAPVTPIKPATPITSVPPSDAVAGAKAESAKSEVALPPKQTTTQQMGAKIDVKPSSKGSLVEAGKKQGRITPPTIQPYTGPGSLADLTDVELTTMTMPFAGKHPPLLRIENLGVSFTGSRGMVKAVRGVSLSLYPKQIVAVVGESGCGKSVTALSILQLLPTPPANYDHGRIWLSHDDGTFEDLLKVDDERMRQIRGGHIAMIFQEPMTSLNPVYTIGEQIIEAVMLHQRVHKAQAMDIAEQSLREVGIAEPRSRLSEYPHQMSGGMRQRVMIAMALSCKPRVLLADEPTTALDVTIQAQILQLLRDIQRKNHMSVLLITHDLGVVAQNADVVAVMYAGRVVEYGSVMEVFAKPLHPYTQGLFASMPVLGRQQKRLETIPGNVPNAWEFPKGCAFAARCGSCQGDVNCTAADPPLLEVSKEHWVACWHAEQYTQGQESVPDLLYRR